MFRVIKIFVISMMFSTAAFAEGWGHHQHFGGYGFGGYRHPYYGGGYYAPRFMPGYYPQPNFAPVPVIPGYGPYPTYGRRGW